MEKTMGVASLSKEEMWARVKKAYPMREKLLLDMLRGMWMGKMPGDVTFYERKPLINVTVDFWSIEQAMSYDKPVKVVRKALENIPFSDGTVANLAHIWNVFPMPRDGFSDDELAAADLSMAEEVAPGPTGKTIRQMISDCYHCTSMDEEDRYLRRWIAS
jgi:hypothetical protein